MSHSPSRQMQFLCSWGPRCPSLHRSLTRNRAHSPPAGAWASCAGGLVRVILRLPSAALATVDVIIDWLTTSRAQRLRRRPVNTARRPLPSRLTLPDGVHASMPQLTHESTRDVCDGVDQPNSGERHCERTELFLSTDHAAGSCGCSSRTAIQVQSVYSSRPSLRIQLIPSSCSSQSFFHAPLLHCRSLTRIPCTGPSPQALAQG